METVRFQKLRLTVLRESRRAFGIRFVVINGIRYSMLEIGLINIHVSYHFFSVLVEDKSLVIAFDKLC